MSDFQWGKSPKGMSWDEVIFMVDPIGLMTVLEHVSLHPGKTLHQLSEEVKGVTSGQLNNALLTDFVETTHGEFPYGDSTTFILSDKGWELLAGLRE